MNDFSQLGFESSHYEHTMRLKEKAEIRRVAKYVGIAYLICVLIPDIFSYFIYDLASSYKSLGFITKIFTHPILSQVYQIAISVLVFTLPYFAVPIGLNVKAKELVTLKPKEKSFMLPLVFMGLGFCAFANIAANMLTDLFASFGLGIYSPSYGGSTTVSEFILTFVAVAVTPAIVEEFAFRGIVLGALRKFGDGFAILISALTFALMHRNFGQFPFAFIVGIILAFATIKTGSVLTAMLIHFLNNGISITISTVTAQLGDPTAKTIIFSLYFALCFLLFFIGLAMMSSKGKDVWKPYRTTHKLTSKQRVNCFFSQPMVIIDTVISIIIAVNLLIPL